MSWQELIQPTPEKMVLPWVGTEDVFLGQRSWRVLRRPPEVGWHTFAVTSNRQARWLSTVVDRFDLPANWTNSTRISGYLVGDRLLPDAVPYLAKLSEVDRVARVVHLLEPGLARFSRVSVCRYDDAWLFLGALFSEPADDAVRRAFEDRRTSLSHIREVSPALDLAFRWETLRREEADQRRAWVEAEAHRVARQEEADRAAGTSSGRRALAVVDFDSAARASLLLSGSELLDARPSATRGEHVVQFRFRARRFECVVNTATLRVVDAGICLQDSVTGRRWDDALTLESLPGVIGVAMDTHVLHVYRHFSDDVHDRDDDSQD